MAPKSSQHSVSSLLAAPAIDPARSFVTLDSSRSGKRQKLKEEDKAALLAHATNQAIVAAQSLILAGSSEATAFKTAKAAAASILMPKNLSFLARMKAKQQVNVVASMALLAAQNAAIDQTLFDKSTTSHSLFMVRPHALCRLNEEEPFEDPNAFHPNDFHTKPMSGHHRQRSQRQDDENSRSSRNSRSIANYKFKTQQLPGSFNNSHNHSPRETNDSSHWTEKKSISETVAKLLAPLEDDDSTGGKISTSRRGSSRR